MAKYLALLLLLPFGGAAQVAQSFIFTLRGQLDPRIEAPAKVYLTFNGWLDSAAVTHGRFELQRRVDKHRFSLHGQSPAPGMGALLLSRSGRGARQELASPHVQEPAWMQRADLISFYIEPGVITFSSTDSLREARVRGPRLNTDWQELLQAVHPYPLARQSLDAAHHPDLAQFVAAHPASLVSLDQVRNLSLSPRDSALTRRLFNVLTPALRRSPKGQQIAQQLTTWRYPLGIGQRAPHFKLPTLQGDSVSLFPTSGWRLLHFYTNASVAEQAERAALVRVQQALATHKQQVRAQLRGPNYFQFALWSIAVDEPAARAAWLAAGSRSEQGMVPVLVDHPGPRSVAALYHVTTTPQNFLLDGQGRIVAKNISSTTLQTLLEQELQRVLKD